MTGANEPYTTNLLRIIAANKVIAINNAVVSMTCDQGTFALIKDIVSELIEIGLA